MRNTYLKNIIVFVLVITYMFFNSSMAFANVPYKTFTEDHKRQYVMTQDAYTPTDSIEKIDEISFSKPSDLYIDSEDNIYVADTGNKRIVVIDKNQNIKKILGEEILGEPTGVFVDNEGFIYVADFGKKLVFKFNQEGKVVKEFNKPTAPLFGKGNPYKPLKVAVDKRGNLYIVGEGTTNGLIQLSPQGDFLGYFGTNDSKFDLRIMFQEMVLTKVQQSKLVSNVPPSVTNTTIDSLGLIYTVTQGDKGKSVKQLDISGTNMFPEDMSFDPLFNDIFVDLAGNIFVISQKGYVYEYDSEGNLIFRFGGIDDGKLREGLFVDPSGIVVNSKGNIYISDKERNNIQIFQPTEFTNNIHEALSLYKEGYYVKSQEPWERVLEMNNLFDLAHIGLGEANYKRQLYQKALEEYKISNYKKGYSDAYWEIRNKWMTENLGKIFFILVGIYALYRLIRKLHRKTGFLTGPIKIINWIKSIKLVKQLLFLFYFIRHPIDGYYEIKKPEKVSILAATILYFIFFIEHLFSLYYTGFIFKEVELTDIMLSKEILLTFIPFFLFVIANYLVSTINDGEGRFKEIYKATIYSFVPYLVFGPILVIISNFLTFNEMFVYEFGNTILMLWTLVLLYIMIREIHNFTFRETFKNIFITLFSMLIIMLVIFIVYVLLDQVYDFVYSAVQELIIRANH
jgi:DNA-binding beta-propeller fold protein YncE